MEEKDIGISESDEKTEDIITEETEQTVEEVPEDTVEVIDESDSGNEEELTQLQQKNEELTNRLLRLQAEFENYKKRTVKEKNAQLKYKSEEFAIELLPIVDNFERALQTEIADENKGFYDGIAMVYNQLQQVFETQGIEKIDAAGKEFDPNLHHAVMQTDDEDQESNVVVEELQKGYMLKDKVIRPAMVKVNK